MRAVWINQSECIPRCALYSKLAELCKAVQSDQCSILLRLKIDRIVRLPGGSPLVIMMSAVKKGSRHSYGPLMGKMMILFATVAHANFAKPQGATPPHR